MQRQWHDIHFLSLRTSLPYTGGLLPGLTSSVEAVDVAVDLERKMIVIISFRPDNFCSRGVFS